MPHLPRLPSTVVVVHPAADGASDHIQLGKPDVARPLPPVAQDPVPAVAIAIAAAPPSPSPTARPAELPPRPTGNRLRRYAENGAIALGGAGILAGSVLGCGTVGAAIYERIDPVAQGLPMHLNFVGFPLAAAGAVLTGIGLRYRVRRLQAQAQVADVARNALVVAPREAARIDRTATFRMAPMAVAHLDATGATEVEMAAAVSTTALPMTAASEPASSSMQALAQLPPDEQTVHDIENPRPR